MSDIMEELVTKYKDGLAEATLFAWESGRKFEEERILKLLADKPEVIEIIKGKKNG